MFIDAASAIVEQFSNIFNILWVAHVLWEVPTVGQGCRSFAKRAKYFKQINDRAVR